MLIDDVKNVMDKLKKNSPLIHCITNPISINQCANAVLSVGAKPIMAEHPKEVCEITKTAKNFPDPAKRAKQNVRNCCSERLWQG